MYNTVEHYERMLRFQGKSQMTIKSYSRNVKDFFLFTRSGRITEEQVTEYLDLLLRKNIEKSTWNQIMYSIRAYCEITKQQFPYFIKKLKVRRKLKQVPLKEEMLDAIRNKEDFKEKAVMLLFYDGWLRRTEAQTLKTKQIDFKKNLIFVTGKGDKDRVVWISEKAKLIFYYYLKFRTNQSNPYFISKEGSDSRYMSKKYLYSVVNSCNVGWHPHLLRHAGATHYYLETGDLIGTSRKLGHEDITTTMIYLSLKREDLVMHKPSPYPLLIRGKFADNH